MGVSARVARDADRRRPSVVAFDVNDTLFDLSPLRAAFGVVGLPRDTMPLWFARVLRDGFAHAAAGTFAAFPDLAGFHLRRLMGEHGEEARDEHVEAVMSAFTQLDPFPDVEPALGLLRERGVSAVTLTNGTREVTQALLQRGHLTELVAACYDVRQAGRWKPAAAPYRWLADELGLSPAELALVAVHSWDCHGAQQAGLTGVWVSREREEPAATMAEPHIRADSLDGAVGALLELPESET